MAGATTRLTNATLATGELVDVTISAGDRDTAGAGRIVAVDPAAGAQRSPGDRHDEHVEHDDLTVELAGHLLTTSLVEPHAHLDKAFLAERIPNPTGDLIGAIHGMHANRDLITVADTIERAERAVRLMVNNGVTLIRTHADVTDANGLTSVEALAEVRRRTAGLCDLQIVALPGFPLTGPAGAPTRALLREALDTGADLVGGCPHLEDDVDGATEVLLAIAAEFGRGVDLHTDETLNPSKLGLADLARRVRASGFPHPVTASHCVSLSMQSESDQQRIAEAVAEAGVSIVALPQTNLFLQGRDHQQAMPRGLTAVRALSRAGVNVCAGADNLQDPFNPIGRGDPLETAGLMIAVGHLLPDEAWSAVTSAARLALLGQRASIAPGQPADLIALPVATVREAIAFTPGQRIVFRNGHRLSP